MLSLSSARRWRRSAAIKRIHFAEEWNEFHHLLIMEVRNDDVSYPEWLPSQHDRVTAAWRVLLFITW